MKQVQDAYMSRRRVRRLQGSERDVSQQRPDDLLVSAIPRRCPRFQARSESVEDAIIGCAFPEAQQGLNMARNAVLLAVCRTRPAA